MKNPSHYMLRDLEKAINADVRKKSEKNGGSPPWLKDYSAQLYDPEYASLGLAERGLLKDLRLIALSRKNKIPNDEAYLRAQLRCSPRTRIAQKLHTLCTAGFLEVHPDAVELPATKPNTAPSTLEPVASQVTLEERREEQTVRSNGSVDVAAPLDLDELEAWQPDEKPAETETNVVELDSRRPQGEINGKPLEDVVGPFLDGLHARAQSP